MNENFLIEETTKEIIERKNPFCVVSIETFGEYMVHDIQTNSSWYFNPYENYAIVPDEMVEGIKETKGFCDIVFNEEGTEIISFIAREVPNAFIPEEEPTQLDAIEAQVIYTAMMTDTLLEA